MLQSASGDVALSSWPTENLEINTVSGEVKIRGTEGKVPKIIALHTVSGEVNITVSKPFEKLSAQTISGEVNLQVPSNLVFSYQLHSISGDFEGIPEGGVSHNSVGDKSLTGQIGKSGSSAFRFESVSGDFNLIQTAG